MPPWWRDKPAATLFCYTTHTMALLREIWGFIFWTHERGTFRYDVMVGLILAFVFLTPRGFFHDRPQPPQIHQIVALEEEKGAFQVDAALLAHEERTLEDGARRLLRAYTGKAVRVLRLEPIRDPDGRLLAYKVWIEE